VVLRAYFYALTLPAGMGYLDRRGGYFMFYGYSIGGIILLVVLVLFLTGRL
jgi:hypothetical protein